MLPRNRRCTQCSYNLELNADNFRQRKDFRGHPIDKYDPICKPCAGKRSRAQAKKARDHRNHPTCDPLMAKFLYGKA